MPLATRVGAWTIRRPLVYDAIIVVFGALVLIYAGIGPGDTTFWGVLGTFVVACLVFEGAYVLHCRRRGLRASEVRAGLADGIIAQVEAPERGDDS